MRSKLLLYSLFCVVALSLSGCKWEDPEPIETTFSIRKHSVTAGEDYVDINFKLMQYMIDGYCFYVEPRLADVYINLSESEDMSSPTTYECTVYDSDDYFPITITDLKPSTTYYYTITVDMERDLGYGNILTLDEVYSFATGSLSAPELTLTTPMTYGNTTDMVTAEATIESDHGSAITDYGFCWGLTIDPTIELDSKVSAFDATQELVDGFVYTADITGLDRATKYYVRAYATNSSGTGYGESYYFASSSWAEMKSLTTSSYGGFAYSAAFVIGTKAYFGTGCYYKYSGMVYLSTMWAYDQSDDSWSEIDTYCGGTTYKAMAFTIDGKGYLGGGRNDYLTTTSFCCYDPDSDEWTSKSDLPNSCNGGVGFAVGGKGYIGVGYMSGYTYDDKTLFEYDPVANSWSEKTMYPGSAESGLACFVIDDKAYMGTGENYDDFWEYDPATNQWREIASFAGGGRDGAVAFSINGLGYVVSGQDSTYGYNNCWEYNPATDEWTERGYFWGDFRGYGVGFAIGNKGYYGMGATSLTSSSAYYNDLWEYSRE